MATTLSRSTFAVVLAAAALMLVSPASAEETEANNTQAKGSLFAAPAKAAPPEKSVPAPQSVHPLTLQNNFSH